MWLFGDPSAGWPFRRVLRLPHPEEPRIEGATMENVNLDAVLTRWLVDWRVPVGEWEHWRKAIAIMVRDDIAAAQTWADEWGRRHLDVNPQWLTPGVIAHEQAHNSYALLTNENKDSFEADYISVQRDRYMRLLYSQKGGMLDELDDVGRHVEAHAEIYRYLGGRMPKSLKAFYPRLLS